jgi:cytochrome c biogenesis protein CcmG, thiol:disulfide interchange protein DsbE
MVMASNKPTQPAGKPASRPDTPAAKLARFALGSVFGLLFIGLCFIMLSAALKGPDTIAVPGVTGPVGLLDKAPPERLKIGDKAPDFRLTQLGGDPVQLSKLRGKTVLINFWATWCDPCKDEMPILQRAYLQYKNQDVVFLAVNVRDSADAAKSYFKTNNLTMPVLIDLTGDVPGGYRVTGYPETYLVDKNGNIGEFHIGPITTDADLESKLQKVLHQADQV